MTPRYNVRPAADLDLDDQAGYLAQEASVAVALRFYDAARTTLEHLAQMPGMGERRESRNPRLAGLRVWRVEGFEKHLIFYLPAADGIDIVRILHGSRDIDRILAEETGDDLAAEE